MDTSLTDERPSHRAIIARNGGITETARKVEVEPNTVKGWNRLDSIPAPHWEAFANAGLATLEELAAAAATRRIAAINSDAEAA